MYQVSDTESSGLLAEKRKSDDSNANAEASQPVSNRAQHLAGSTSKKSQRRTPCHEGTMLDASSPIRKLGATPSQAILRHGAGSGKRRTRTPAPCGAAPCSRRARLSSRFTFQEAEEPGPDPDAHTNVRTQPFPAVPEPCSVSPLGQTERGGVEPLRRSARGIQSRIRPGRILFPGWSCSVRVRHPTPRITSPGTHSHESVVRPRISADRPASFNDPGGFYLQGAQHWSP